MRRKCAMLYNCLTTHVCCAGQESYCILFPFDCTTLPSENLAILLLVQFLITEKYEKSGSGHPENSIHPKYAVMASEMSYCSIRTNTICCV